MSERMPDPAEMTAAAASAKENTNIDNPAPAEEAAVPAATHTEEIQSPTAKIPLAWHRFLTRFYLWIAALYHFAQAALVFTGLSYHSAAARDAVYAGLPRMQYLDWGFAALLALGGLVQIIAAVRLAGMKKNAPGMLAAAYILLLLAETGYGAGRYVLTGLTFLTGSIVGLTAVYIAMLLVNASYYKKRKEIFNP